MPRPSSPVPTLRHHRPTNQAVTTVRLPDGGTKDFYLGKHGSAAARNEYARVVALVAANGGTYPANRHDLTVSEALARYFRHAATYYRTPDGAPSRCIESLKSALRYVRVLFASTPLADFGPPQLKAVRQSMIDDGRVRTNINRFVGLIRQFFRWCVEEGLIPASVLETLRAVSALSPGRSGATESAPREPADPAAVEASLPFLSPAVRAIVLLLRHTGARPTELLRMTVDGIDRTGEVWRYTPTDHKTAWKLKTRTIHMGPDAQAVLAPWLADAVPGKFIFSPAKSDAMRMAERSAARKTPRFPSHMRRNETKRVGAKRKRPPADRYDARALAVAVARACEKAGVKPYTPYELRHLKAVELRERFGLESVRAVLGQSSMAMAEHYAKRADEALANAAAKQMG